jgi:chromate transporter
LKEGLIPLALGLILASGVSMMRTADRDLLTAAISFTVAAFVVFSQWNPLWALGAGTCVSVVTLHLSRFR